MRLAVFCLRGLVALALTVPQQQRLLWLQREAYARLGSSHFRRFLRQRRCHKNNDNMELPEGGQLYHLACMTFRRARYYPFPSMGREPRRPSLVQQRRPPRRYVRPDNNGIATGRCRLSEPICRQTYPFPTSRHPPFDITSFPPGSSLAT